MCAVDFKGIEAGIFGIKGGLGKGGNGVGNVGIRHGGTAWIIRPFQTGRAFDRGLRDPFGLKTFDRTGMPELWAHFATSSMHGLGNIFPASNGFITVEERNARIIAR